MIALDDLRKDYGSMQVLRGLSLTARDGAVTGLVGPNGAGKSTALKILVGLLSADSGAATLDGFRYGEHPDGPRGVGIMLSAEWIPARLTGRGYLRYVADLKGLGPIDLDASLASVGLADAANRRVKSYSLGMRQRLGLANALLGDPRHLILDEPVNGLDIDGVRWVRDLLRRRADDGACVLLSSHLLSELELVADDVVLLADGVVGASGSIAELRATGETHVLVESDDDARLAQELTAAGMRVVAVQGALKVEGASLNQVAVAAGSSEVRVRSLRLPQRTLEDAYLQESRGDEVRA